MCLSAATEFSAHAPGLEETQDGPAQGGECAHRFLLRRQGHLQAGRMLPNLPGLLHQV